MRIHDRLKIALAMLLLTSGAGMQGSGSSEAKAALAPTGKLRVAFVSVPIYATKDAATGELKGVAIDLGKELAHRIGATFEPVAYSSFPALVKGATSGEWDVGFTAVTHDRATEMNLSIP